MEKEMLESQHHSKSVNKVDAVLDAEELDISTDAKHQRYIGILKQVLPHLGRDEDKIIYAQVMLALKLEGVIGKDLSNEDSEMVNTIKESIMSSEEQKDSALLVADRLLNQ